MPVITQTPYMSPDALRATLQLRKRFYDLHTKRSAGYMDLNGLQYTGTVENFGSEILLESRKMKMQKPPIASAVCNDTLSYYFNIQYSDLIDTYDQQNMLMACIKPNTMLSNHTYQIQFTDCERVVMLRAEADGDTTVHPRFFYRTFINPVLMIDNDAMPLFVNGEDNTDHHAVYYFAMNSTTENFIDESSTDSTILTIDLKSYDDLPFIWFCVDTMQSYPSFDWVGNTDFQNRPLLSNGSNGQHQHQLFPYIYGVTNVPEELTDVVWYIKAYGDFVDTESERNYSTRVTKIEFIAWNADESAFTSSPVAVRSITYDESYTKISLQELTDGWDFRRPTTGDYDYDDITYNNPVYAIIPLSRFESNYVDTSVDVSVEPAFHVIFDTDHYVAYESETVNMVSGAHIDFTTDHSDHSVIKKFGTIYGLNEFDGLPPYFNYYLGKTIHRAHVELYTIRDNANSLNQTVMEKQTAAIILDSSIPDNEIHEILPSLRSVIVYSHDRLYVTDRDAIVSNINFATDIVFVDKNHFADRTIEKYVNEKRFVYNGYRHFSLGIPDLDPSLEYGRGYLITNDPSSYENNDLTDHIKSERTMARICDIPTTYTQLQNISGVSPTLVIDTKYVRQTASFNESDFQRLWNGLQTRWYRLTILRRYTPGGAPIDPPVETIEYTPYLNRFLYAFDPDTIETQVGFTVTPTRIFPLLEKTISGDVSFHVSEPGTDYAVDDILGFNIGGVFLHAVVTDVTGVDNELVDFDLSADASDEIAFANLDGLATPYDLTSTSGNGSGARMVMDVSSELFNESIPTQDGGVAGIFTLIKDDNIEGLYVLPFDHETNTWLTDHMIQLTGYLDPGVYAYDYSIDRKYHTFPQVLLNNMLKYFQFEPNQLIYPDTELRPIEYTAVSKALSYPDYTIESIMDGTDLSSLIDEFGYNKWNSFIAVVPDTSHTSSYVNAWSYDMECMSDSENNDIFIKHNRMHVKDYDGSWNGLKFGYLNGRIIPYMYDIMHTTNDVYTDQTNILRLISKETVTLREFLSSSESPSDMDRLISNDGVLQYNLYRFDHLSRLHQLMTLEESISQETDEHIEDLIVNAYGDKTVTSIFDSYKEYEYVSGTEYQIGMLLVDRSTNRQYHTLDTFTATTIEHDLEARHISFEGFSTKRNDLVSYYMMNQYPSSVYDAPKLALYQSAGKSIDSDTHHIGGFIPLTDVIDKNIYVDGNTKDDQLVYFFRIDDMDETDLRGFRMYDDGVDISSQSVLIIDGKEYVFHNSTWQWNYHTA